jgi:hypothetical protein
MRRLLFAMMLLFGSARALVAQGESTQSLRLRGRHVFECLKIAIAHGDSAAVAQLVAYPLRVNRTIRLHSDVDSKARLLRQYRAIFTDSVQRAILAQDADSLFFNWQGTMVGDGVVWISTVCGPRNDSSCHDGIVTVNLPSRRGSRSQ